MLDPEHLCFPCTGQAWKPFDDSKALSIKRIKVVLSKSCRGCSHFGWNSSCVACACRLALFCVCLIVFKCRLWFRSLFRDDGDQAAGDPDKEAALVEEEKRVKRIDRLKGFALYVQGQMKLFCNMCKGRSATCTMWLQANHTPLALPVPFTFSVVCCLLFVVIVVCCYCCCCFCCH